MNRLIQSPLASDPNKQQPLPVASILFMQDTVKEQLMNSAIGIIGSNYSSSKAYIIWGCVRTGAADTASGAGAISAGAIFYNGEYYTVPAATYTLASNYAVGTITTTNPSPDPILLKDGTSTNVHNVVQIVFTAGTSGSGTFNYASTINTAKVTSITTKNTQSFANGGSRTDIAGITFTTPNDGFTRTYKITYKGQLTVGVTSAGGATTTLMVDGSDVDACSAAINLAVGSLTYFNGALSCQWLASIGPNKIIKVQGISVVSNITIDNSVMIIEEIR